MESLLKFGGYSMAMNLNFINLTLQPTQKAAHSSRVSELPILELQSASKIDMFFILTAMT